DASWPCGLHDASSIADDPTPTRARHALSMRAGATRSLRAVAGAPSGSSRSNGGGSRPAGSRRASLGTPCDRGLDRTPAAVAVFVIHHLQGLKSCPDRVILTNNK